jgi:hypothetical protein
MIHHLCGETWLVQAARWIWNFLDSLSLHISFEVAWFGLGVHWVTTDRAWGKEYFDGVTYLHNNTEEEWDSDFGQIFPLLMLPISVLTALQAYGDEKTK